MREGPAFVTEADGTKRAINGGHWISRTEAERLAAEGRYVFSPQE